MGVPGEAADALPAGGRLSTPRTVAIAGAPIIDRAAAERREQAVRELVEAAGEAILSEIPIDSPVFFRLRAAIAAVRELDKP